MTGRTPYAEAWTELFAELDRWQAEGRVAYFWWRDDDAAEVTPALERLLDASRAAAVPLVLAVVPGQASAALSERLAAAKGILAVQHGLVHLNHAVAPEKKNEFPTSRPLEDRLQDLRQGQALMDRLFLRDRLRPVLVPPWNRLGPDIIGQLPKLGFMAVSSFRLRQSYWATDGLIQLNTHIDPVDWRGGDSAAGCRQSLVVARQSLHDIRVGQVPLQPLGLLTHHLRHDAAGWDFITEFLERIAAHPAACWINVDTALEIGRPADNVISRS